MKTEYLAILAAAAISSAAGNNCATQKLAWAHYVGWTMPENVSFEAQNHYAFPVDEYGANPYREEVQRALASGLDGFFVDVIMQYNWRPGYYYTVENLLKGAEGTSFKVAPCLDAKTDVSNQIDHICWMLQRFGNHPNYPRAEGRYVLATYTYPEWTPDEWRQMLYGCAKAGYPLYLVGNVKYSCGVLLPARMNRYKDVFDVCYGFAYIGGETLSSEDETRGIADWCRANGKRYMPCIAPGYLATWLKGHNPSYCVFQGLDKYLREAFCARKTGGDWLHFTTWNDHCETTLEPMLLTPGNKPLMRAVTAGFKSENIPAEEPDVLFAYHREELPGTLLRIEALRLPARKGASAALKVSGGLYNQEGACVAKLEAKSLAAGWDRTEWLVRTPGLATNAALTPRFKMTCANTVREADFSQIFFRAPWIENNVTVREAFQNRVNGATAQDVRFTVKARGGHFVAGLCFTNEATVARAILFCNDRPVGQFRATPPQKGWAGMPIHFQGTCRFNLTLSEGNVVTAKRRLGGGKGKDGFDWSDGTLTFQPGADNYDNVSAWLEGPTNAVVTLTTDAETQTFTLAELGAQSRGAARGGKMTMFLHPDCTLRDMPRLDKKEGVFRLDFFGRTAQPGDAYFARLEFADGRVQETRVITPFLDETEDVAATLLETPITLETMPGAEGLPRVEPLVTYREFLTSEGNMPIKGTTQVAAKVSPAVYRHEVWPLEKDGEGTYGHRPIVTTGCTFAAGPDGKAGLRFTGSEKAKVPLLMWPMDAGAVAFDLALEDSAGETRSVISREGTGPAFTLRQLGDGRLEAHWSGVTSGAVYDRRVSEDRVVTSKTALKSGVWTRVKIAHDNRKLAIYLNGKLDAEVTYAPFRAYGATTVYLGGGEKNLSGSRGYIKNLAIGASTIE